MDEYLIDKRHINIFKRISDWSEDNESAERLFMHFLDYVIPYIESNIDKPYKLFKHLKETTEDELLRYVIFEEIGLYFLDNEVYNSVSDNKKLDTFLDFVDEEKLSLSEKLDIRFSSLELLSCLLEDIRNELDKLSTQTEKKDYLLTQKLEFTSRLNDEAVYAIDKLITILEEQDRINLLYVDLSRINELKEISNSNWDTLRLVQLCDELNNAYKFKNYSSIPMIVRAIIDHVPPIFSASKFKDLIAKYGSKSFKESMQHLDNSLRKIADSMMHSQIRNKEILPNHSQIDFRADLDVLLAEICRILKK